MYPTTIWDDALIATIGSPIANKKPTTEPIPTTAASKGPKNIAINIGTCDAKVAENGGIYTLRKGPNITGIIIDIAINNELITIFFRFVFIFILLPVLYIH